MGDVAARCAASTMPLARVLLFGVALAYLAMPGHDSAVLSGLPLNIPGLLVALGLFCWQLALPGAPSRVRLAVAAIVLLSFGKLILGWLAPGYGLVAEYRAGGENAPIERSTAWPELAGTRVDQALNFRGAEFPVHFFNDVRRFNYFTANDPRRDLLPFSVRWRGSFVAPAAGRYAFSIEANGRAALTLPGLRTLTAGTLEINSTQRVQEFTAMADLDGGPHPIEITYARPGEGMPWLVVRSAQDGEPLRPLATPSIVRGAGDVQRLGLDALLRPLAVVIDVAYLAILAILLAGHVWLDAQGGSHNHRIRQQTESAEHGKTYAGHRLERPLLGLFALAMSLVALLSHMHLSGQTVLLSGGNDWLAYVGLARDVLIDGPLVREGRALGQGQPFYYQPLYIYWLALVQLILGEGLFGALFANAILGVIANVLVYALARELFGRPAALAALVLFAAYLSTVFAPTAGLLLSENLLIPLVPLLLLLLARAARQGTWPPLLGSAFVIGLAGLTRTTPLALLLPAVLILLLAYRRLGFDRRQALVRIFGFVAICLVTISPATVRNLVVSGRPVLITSSAGANLWEAHRPSARVDLSRIDRDPVYERLSLDRYTREVAEFVKQDPIGYLATLVPMALFAIGIIGAPFGSSDVHVGLLGMWVAYLFVVVALPSARRPATWFLHAFVWSHLAQMTIFFSHQYGFRLILPMYVAMAPIAGYGLAVALLNGWRWSHRWRTSVFRGQAEPFQVRGSLSLLIGGVGSLALLAAAPSPDRAREAFYGLNGDAAIAARQAGRIARLELADVVYFAGDDSRSDEVAYLRGLAYPAMRWFDGARGVIFPPRGERGLYVLPDRAAPAVAGRCLDRSIVEREQDEPTGAWVDIAVATRDDGQCGAPRQTIGADFEGTARLIGYDVTASVEPGQTIEAVMQWEPLARPANRSRPFIRLADSKGRRWGEAEVTVYPSSSWRPGELAIGTARLDADPTLPPGDYQLVLGFSLGAGSARLAEDGPWGWRGQTEVRAPGVTLVSRSTPLLLELLPITIPRTATLGQIALLGASLDRETPRAGDRVRLSLYWQNLGHRLAARDVSIVLRQPSGAVVHEWRGEPVDGTYPTTGWKPNEIVRDTWDLVLPASLEPGPIEIGVGLTARGQPAEERTALTTLAVQPVQRQFGEPNVRVRQDAILGDVARLIGFEIRNRRVKAGDTLDVGLVWQALASTANSYTVSVLLTADGDRIVVQQDAEPAAGRRPTTGWRPGEYIEDAHRLRVPRETARGRYQLAVVMYRTDDDQRLLDAAGADRVILMSEIVVE